jgi:sec-independent protein translocase protein TatB
VFGLSFSEVVVIAIVALVFVGPQKLPGLLGTLGAWARKLRVMTTEMRAQSGIDDVLRSEGLQGGLTELRSLMRGHHVYAPPAHHPPPPSPAPASTASDQQTAPSQGAFSPDPVEEDPYANLEVDESREYPLEGPDAYGAIPDDLIDGAYPDPAPVAPEAAADEAPPTEVALTTETAPAEAAPTTEVATAEAAPTAQEPAVPAPLASEPAATPASTPHER